ncbi:MAG: hypothetical protein LBS30_00535 [Planctomycetota bacterium]|jgi:hypothetical protein|nr:hypothetical protein [Planctomycetota bacterium]
MPYRRRGRWNTAREDELKRGEANCLEVVFENGKLIRDMTFADVRANAGW